MDKMKKIFNFLVVIVAAFSVIGGAGWLFYDKHIANAIGVLLLGAMAFPYVKACFKEMQ